MVREKAPHSLKLHSSTFRVNGEPLITSNRSPIRQQLAQYKCLYAIIDSKGNFRELDLANCNRKPFEYEYSELKQVLKDFLDIYLGGRLGANSRKMITNNADNEEYNIYGCIVTKRKRECSYLNSC